MSPLIPRAELDFLLHDWLGVTERHNELSREAIDGLLDLSEKLAAEQFASHYQAADRIEPTLDDGRAHIHPAVASALRKYAELGLFSAGFAPELGGMGLPSTVCLASFAQFLAANVSTSAYIMLTTANARLIAAFGNAQQISSFALPQIEGRWFGTMCLSEPQAGSGLGDIVTRAVQDGDDELGYRYRLTGNKMWISGGDQDASDNIIHLVLAKVPTVDGVLQPGTKGISLFLVPKLLSDGQRNDVTVAALNHKMGYRGTTNCALNFGENEGAIGWLVGEEGDGMRQMFKMMNEARIVIGLGGAALAWRGYRHAADYARERKQGRSAKSGPNSAAPIIDHVDIRHMLLAQKVIAEGALALCLYCAGLVDRAGEDGRLDPDASALLDLLTPVTKSWPSEQGLIANDLAIQIHGGYGYTRDFPVEQVYRDNRLNPIHEGTTGIQALDLVGRKLLRDGGRSYGILRSRVDATLARASQRAELVETAKQLRAAFAVADEAISGLAALESGRTLDNATAFLRGFGHVVLGWIWLDLALCAADLGERDPLRIGKLTACRYFHEVELPHAHVWLKLAASGNDLAATAPDEIFA